MKLFPFIPSIRLPTLILSLVATSTTMALPGTAADRVEMQNGDRYIGKVLSLNDDSLVMENETLGKLVLPRIKVASIMFSVPATKAVARPPAPNKQLPASPTLRFTNSMAAQLGAHSNLIGQVQQQFLSGAGQEAQDKFNELVSGLLSGKLSVEDIRAQAKSTVDQVRAAKKDLGEDAGWALEGYLAILDQFLKASEPAVVQGTNVPGAKPKPASRLEQDAN